MSRQAVRERIRQLQAVLEEDRVELETVSSPEAARSAASTGLARLPYVTINDVIALRGVGVATIEDLEEHVLEVPESSWEHVLWLARARVLDVDLKGLEAKAPAGTNGEAPRCLALTKAGTRCRNRSRSGSKYCSSHKGYQPTEEELAARREGLLPEA